VNVDFYTAYPQEELNGRWLLQRKRLVHYGHGAWTNGCLCKMLLTCHPRLPQVTGRRDLERKAFSKMFETSGSSEKIDEVYFLMPHPSPFKFFGIDL
jgi:hypothetical protein